MSLLKNTGAPIRIKFLYLCEKVRIFFKKFIFFSRVEFALLLCGLIEFLVNRFDLLPEFCDRIIKALDRNKSLSRFYRGAYREQYKRSDEPPSPEFIHYLSPSTEIQGASESKPDQKSSSQGYVVCEAVTQNPRLTYQEYWDRVRQIQSTPDDSYSPQNTKDKQDCPKCEIDGQVVYVVKDVGP